jgi:thiol-disulfide isomerase/thioredoxin
VRVNFNITMMDLKCEYVAVDVFSALGTEQNVTAHIAKYQVDANGVKQRWHSRNKDQHDIDLFDSTVTRDLDELYANGEDAVSLAPETLEFALNENEYVFVDFFASWCSHCRDLAPTWETLAELMTDVATNIVEKETEKGEHEYTAEDLAHAKKLSLPVFVAKVDCVSHQNLCWEQRVNAYPTLRLFVDGERWRGGDYTGHRTVIEMADWLAQIEDTHKSELEAEGEDKMHRKVKSVHDGKLIGC